MTLSLAPGRGWLRAAALLLPPATCAVLAAVRDDVPAATAALVLVVWVVGVAAGGDRVAGLLAAASGGVWFDFFLTAPYRTFAIHDAADVEVTVLLVVIGAVVSELALWGRRQQAAAGRRAGYLDDVLGAAQAASDGGDGTADRAALTATVAGQIAEVLGVSSVVYRPGPVHDQRIALLDRDGVLTRGGREVDVARVGLPYDEHTAVVVRRGPRVVGHFLITSAGRKSYPTAEQRRVAGLLADQVVVAVGLDGLPQTSRR